MASFTAPLAADSLAASVTILRTSPRFSCAMYAPPPGPLCPYDPRPLRNVPLGMFHCPLCDEMVVAGLPHPTPLADLVVPVCIRCGNGPIPEGEALCTAHGGRAFG